MVVACSGMSEGEIKKVFEWSTIMAVSHRDSNNPVEYDIIAEWLSEIVQKLNKKFGYGFKPFSGDYADSMLFKLDNYNLLMFVDNSECDKGSKVLWPHPGQGILGCNIEVGFVLVGFMNGWSGRIPLGDPYCEELIVDYFEDGANRWRAYLCPWFVK